MQKPNYKEIFRARSDYKPPENPEELRKDTQYPNKNSIDFRNLAHLQIRNNVQIQKYYEAFDVNSEGEIILARNSLIGRIWEGTVCGFKNVKNIGQKAYFEVKIDENVTHLKYLNSTMFIITTNGGTLQLWSSRSEKTKAGDKYCLFQIEERAEHIGSIDSFDVLKDKVKIVTGCRNCCLKVWDTGEDFCELYSINTMQYGHSRSITGVASSPNSESIFASCGMDNSAFIWDCRKPRPATELYENYEYSFTSLCWDEIKNEQIIVLGDETGKIHTLDIRVPNKIQRTQNVFKSKAVKKIKAYRNYLAVIGNTNIVKVFEYDPTKTDKYFNLKYENDDTQDFIRDLKWNNCTENEFFTTGWDSKFRTHNICNM